MALTYVSSLVKSKGYGKVWVDKDIRTLTFVELFLTYAQVYLRLTDSFSQQTRDFHVSAHRDLIPDVNHTINQWLVAAQHINLPYEDNLLAIKKRSALFCNGNLANFKAKHVSHLFAPDVDVPASDRRNLLVTKDIIDSADLHSQCLFTVNGMFHRSELTGGGVVVIEGGATQRTSNSVHFGILDFERIGVIDQIAITEDMIIAEEDVPLRQSVYIKSPSTLEGKSLLLVIGGYLFVGENDVFTYTGNDIIHVNMNKLGLLERLYESNNRLAMDFLNDYYVGDTPFDYLRPEDIRSDAFITAYLTLPQSFLVIVDTEDLIAEKQLLENDKIIGEFITETPPNSLLQTGYGRCEDYWWQRHYHNNATDLKRYVLSVETNLTENFAFRNHGWKEEPIVGRMLVAEKPYYQEAAWFMHLSATELIPTAL